MKFCIFVVITMLSTVLVTGCETTNNQSERDKIWETLRK